MTIALVGSGWLVCCGGDALWRTIGVASLRACNKFDKYCIGEENCNEWKNNVEKAEGDGCDSVVVLVKNHRKILAFRARSFFAAPERARLELEP